MGRRAEAYMCWYCGVEVAGRDFYKHVSRCKKDHPVAMPSVAGKDGKRTVVETKGRIGVSTAPELLEEFEELMKEAGAEIVEVPVVGAVRSDGRVVPTGKPVVEPVLVPVDAVESAFPDDGDQRTGGRRKR